MTVTFLIPILELKADFIQLHLSARKNILRSRTLVVLVVGNLVIFLIMGMTCMIRKRFLEYKHLQEEEMSNLEEQTSLQNPRGNLTSPQYNSIRDHGLNPRRLMFPVSETYVWSVQIDII